MLPGPHRCWGSLDPQLPGPEPQMLELLGAQLSWGPPLRQLLELLGPQIQPLQLFSRRQGFLGSVSQCQPCVSVFLPRLFLGSLTPTWSTVRLRDSAAKLASGERRLCGRARTAQAPQQQGCACGCCRARGRGVGARRWFWNH